MVRIEVRRRIARITAASLVFGWGVSWATVAAAYPDLINMPWAQMGVGGLIAAWGGGSATLDRYLKATYEERPFYWKAEVGRDIAVSVSIGSVSYWAAWLWSWPIPMLGLTLLLAGYSGTAALRLAAEKWMVIERKDK